MRTLRMLLLILCCYLAGWVTADLLVPIVLAGRVEDRSAGAPLHGNVTVVTQNAQQTTR